MDMSSLSEISNLPFTGLTSVALFKLLGPTANYLGGKGQEYTQKSIENLERVFNQASKRLPQGAAESSGSVPPRVLRGILNEGAYVEDEVAAAYLGGVLASSKSESGRDDRGVYINALISRLSVFQIRLHYVCYMAAHDLFQGVTSDFGIKGSLINRVEFGYRGLLMATGFHLDTSPASHATELQSILMHSVNGLNKEELISDWELSDAVGLSFQLTPIGVELFLWASGQGRRNVEYFFDRDFTPVEGETDDDDIWLVPGMNCEVELDDGTLTTVHGYCYAENYLDLLSCPIKPTVNAQ